MYILDHFLSFFSSSSHKAFVLLFHTTVTSLALCNINYFNPQQLLYHPSLHPLFIYLFIYFIIFNKGDCVLIHFHTELVFLPTINFLYWSFFHFFPFLSFILFPPKIPSWSYQTHHVSHNQFFMVLEFITNFFSLSLQTPIESVTFTLSCIW